MLKKILLIAIVTVATIPFSSAYAATVGAYKRPITIPGFSWVGDHTYICLGTGVCYGYDSDSIVHTSGSAVQGGTQFYSANVAASNVCVAQVVNTWMGTYGYDAVCHQNANRGLYFTGQTLGSNVAGYSVTKALFGVYGKTWSTSLVSPACQQYRASAIALRTSAVPAGATDLKGPESKANEHARNEYYTQQIVAGEQKAMTQPNAEADDASRIADEFSYTLYEILGSDYSKEKVDAVRKLDVAMIRQDEVNVAAQKKGVLSKQDFNRNRNAVVAAWLHQVYDVLGPKDFEAVFGMKANQIDTAWSNIGV